MSDKATWNSSFWLNEIEKLGSKEIRESLTAEDSEDNEKIKTEQDDISTKTEVETEEKRISPNIRTEFIDCSLTDLILGTDSALIQSVLKRIDNN
ncbi:hypothetical protein K501DRAFT_284236 [Backusella circina FSU 941]|nr:hypothetical protein K501DRAFT_284236 [Backusella circina FSU 941]